MSKYDNDDFLSKFADRVEKVGRDGVMGLMKSTGAPINMDKIQNYYNQNYFDRRFQRNNQGEIHKNILEENHSAFVPRTKKVYKQAAVRKVPDDGLFVCRNRFTFAAGTPGRRSWPESGGCV